MKARSLIVGAIVLFGVVGLVSTLINDPFSLFQRLLTIVVIGAIFYGIYRFYISRRSGSSANWSYRKAAKQSKRRFSASQTKPKKTKKIQKPLRKRSDVKLTVIEGKKSKKNNRAL
ncbi:hypothetical protein Q75_09675 [Bacillus coahuilensis p1.1.43]|uniref:YqhP n=1 Tax=Bacillus coahuilensis p1.1.43 TaxID=1150625 RepID=A0A147K7Q7_9BACI|nr:SA1362 family protein [Bacillus coahuilensis]KUP06189.1 hypothetical protein Q75_09675 [Bacillus coahuilensis p1.1.43]